MHRRVGVGDWGLQNPTSAENLLYSDEIHVIFQVNVVKFSKSPSPDPQFKVTPKA